MGTAPVLHNLLTQVICYFECGTDIYFCQMYHRPETFLLSFRSMKRKEKFKVQEEMFIPLFGRCYRYADTVAEKIQATLVMPRIHLTPAWVNWLSSTGVGQGESPLKYFAPSKTFAPHPKKNIVSKSNRKISTKEISITIDFASPPKKNHNK